jgi:hypothetical protein
MPFARVDHFCRVSVCTLHDNLRSGMPPPNQAAPSWPDTAPPPMPSVPPPSSSTDGTTPWASDSTPWPEAAGSWGEVQPALPPKQNPRPASVQRKGSEPVTHDIIFVIINLTISHVWPQVCGNSRRYHFFLKLYLYPKYG